MPNAIDQEAIIDPIAEVVCPDGTFIGNPTMERDVRGIYLK